MNLIRKDVLRLRKELIQQLIVFLTDECIEPGDCIPIRRVSLDFQVNDGKEQGQHTADHGQHLSEENVEYLLRQADDVFEEKFNVTDDEVKSYWVLLPPKSIESTIPETA